MTSFWLAYNSTIGWKWSRDLSRHDLTSWQRLPEWCTRLADALKTTWKMDENQENKLKTKTKRTPLGRGKRSRRQHCKKAIQARWQKKFERESCSESLTTSDVQEHVLSTHGSAGTPRSFDPTANQNFVPVRDCTARRKLATMQNYIDAVEEGDDDRERCFFELKCLKHMISKMACQECGGSLSARYGDKMGYSREIRISCEVCTLIIFSSPLVYQ